MFGEIEMDLIQGNMLRTSRSPTVQGLLDKQKILPPAFFNGYI